MLRPTKYSNPDETTVAVSTLMLKQLMRKRIIRFDDLLEYTKKYSKSAERLFIPAINLLYLLCLIDYKKKTDSFEYLG